MIINIIGNIRKIVQAGVLVGTVVYADTAYSVQSVRMMITDQAGNQLSQVQVRQPFMCVVTVEGVGSGTYYPRVEGIQDFLLQPRPDIKRHDAQRTVEYQYRLRIDEVGEYLIGPAQITDGNKNYYSNEVTVTVDTSMIIADAATPAKNKSKKKRQPWVVSQIDAPEIYVGQPLLCTVSFYAPKDGNHTFQNMYPPIPHGFKKSLQQGIEPFEEKVDGEWYAGVRAHWTIYAEAAGKYMIPGCRVDYMVTERNNSNSRGFGRWISFMSVSSRQETVHSNAVHVVVKNVPPYTKSDVAATVIGSISQCTVSIDSSNITLGDGAHLVVDVEGDRCLERMANFTFSGIPDALRVYDSKAIDIPPHDSQEPWRKKFEFVVQGVKPGTVIIPAQTIACFDVHTGSYRLVSSKPLTVTIVGDLPSTVQGDNDGGGANNHVSNTEHHASSAADMQEGLPNPLAAIVTTGWYNSTADPYSWRLFWWLFFAPLCMGALWLVGVFARRRIMRNERYWISKTAWYRARWCTMRAVRVRNDAALYHIVLSYIAEKKHVSEHVVNEEYARTVVQTISQDPIFIAQWDALIRDLAARAFCGHLQDGDRSDMGSRVIEWINRLEGAL